MLWLNLLHLYQPANIDKKHLVLATEKSYERILRALEEHPEIKFTLNIAGCLLVRWDEELGRADLIRRFKKLLHRGQIELTGSAAYHALLPLVSEAEAEAQIIEQEKVLKKYFGARIKLKGFFLPELAYSPAVAKLIKRRGYRWLMLDEISAGKKIETEKIYLDKNSNLKIIFRNRRFSESFVPETILKNIDKKQIVVTASDAELYGLRHLDQPASFEKLLKNKNLRTETLSAFLNQRAKMEKIKLRPASWQSTEKELKDHLPFALWQNPNNKIQKNLWQLAHLAERLAAENKKDKNGWWARWHLVRGLASCTFWWASNHDFRKVFGPLAWNPDEVEKGINELARSIRSLEKSTNLKTKLGAEKLITETKNILWQTHWKNR